MYNATILTIAATDPRGRAPGARPGAGQRNEKRALFLRLLHGCPEGLSRVDLARRTGLPEGTVSRVVAELVRDGLLMRRGEERDTGGRPAIRLELNSSELLAMGADIQEGETKIALGDVTGRVLLRKQFATPEKPGDAISLLADTLLEWLRKWPVEKVEGLGVCLRGIVNSETGVVELGSSAKWNGLPVRDLLSLRLKIPVHVDNNIRTVALQEHRFGSLERYRSQLYVRVDEGVGAGLILNGQLYRGPRMAAGEIGQMTLADLPGEAVHNRPGCLEQLAANPAICASYAGRNGASGARPLRDSSARVRSICQLALSGDAAAAATIQRAGRYLGRAITNIVWALDIEAVVVDGVLTEAWPILAPAIRQEFPADPELFQFRHLVLRPCSMGHDAPLAGSLSLAFQDFFSSGGHRKRSVRPQSANRAKKEKPRTVSSETRPGR
ncbi:MAG: ROK family transcriptional regulator [Bryobacteraceae bacterium]